MKTRVLIDNRYAIEKKLGEGQSGEVYLARDRMRDNQPVALKILHPYLGKEAGPADFSSEFQTLTQLSHPHLAKVFDFGTTGDGRLFFTTEYFEGVEITDIDEIRRDEDLLLDILVQICRGLEYIHSRGLVHYDIKPANILVEKKEDQYQVKIVDFSLAGKATHLIKGTIEYIAPEIVKGLSVDRRADLFSLGVTFYEILTGRLPHAREKKIEIIESHLKSEKTPLSGTLSEPWQRLFSRLLAVEPSKRFSSANEVIKAVNENFEASFTLETESTQKSYILSGQWTGREEEFELLKSIGGEVFPQLATPQKERGKRVCIISGESGIGKSRLLREFRYYLQLHKVPLFFVSCVQQWEKAYGPFRDILSQVPMVFPQSASQARELLGQLEEAGTGWSQEEPPLSDSEAGSHAQLNFLEKLVQFFIDLALKNPYAILLEDLHLADEGTEALFEYLSRNLYISPGEIDYREIIGGGDSRVPLLIFSTFNRSRARESFKSLLARLSIEREAFELPLRRLQKWEISSLVSSAFNWEKVAPSLLDFLFDTSRGNPLFLEELLLSLVEDGIISPTQKGWIFEEKLPESKENLEALLQERMEQLGGLQIELLEWMSVFNRPLPLSILEEVFSPEGEEISAIIEALVERKFIRRTLGEKAPLHALSHPYYRQLIYSGLSPGKKREFHGRAAEILIGWKSKTSEISLEEIAGHLLRGDKRDKLVEYALKAATKNRDLHAHHRAAYYFEIALEHLEKDGEKRAHLTWELAKIFELTGDFESAIPLLKELVEDPERGHFISAAKSLIRLYIHTGQFDEARAFVQPLLENLESREEKERIEIQNSLATLWITKGDIDKGLQLCSEIQEELGEEDSEQKAVLLNNLGVAHLLQNQYEKARQYFEKGLQFWKDRSNPYQSAKILVNMGNCSLYLGRPQKAADHYEQALETLREIGDLYHTANCLNNLAALYLWESQYKKSLPHNLESYRIRRKIGSRRGIAMSLCNLGKAFSGLGKYSESLSLLRESLSLYEEMDDLEGRTVSRLCLAEIYFFLGLLDKAHSHLEKGEKLAREQSNQYYLARVLHHRGKVYQLEGEWNRAQTLYEEAFEILDGLQTRKERNMVLLDLASLALERHQEGDRAREYLDSLHLIPQEIFKDVMVRYHLVQARIYQEEKKLARVSKELEQARELVSEVQDPALELEVYHAMGRLYHEGGKYATAGKYYIGAMERIKEIYLSLNQNQKKRFLKDSRRQSIKEDMYRLKKEAELREKEIIKHLEEDKKESGERLFQEKNKTQKPFTSEEMDKIYINPIHFRRIWEEHRLLLKFQEINHQINSDLHLSHLLPIIMKSAMELTGAVRGYLLRDKDGGDWTFEVAWEKDKGEIDSPALSQPEVARKAFDEGKSMVMDMREKAVEREVSVLCVPLKIKGEVMGLIYMEKEGKPSFSPRHLDIIETFGDQAAISIENALLVEKVEAAEERVQGS